MVEHAKSKVDKIPFKPTKVLLFASLFMVAFTLHDGYNIKETIRENTKYFNAYESLECLSGFTSYFVSKKSGWIIIGDSFSKNDILARADRCALINEEKR